MEVGDGGVVGVTGCRVVAVGSKRRDGTMEVIGHRVGAMGSIGHGEVIGPQGGLWIVAIREWMLARKW